MPPRTTDPAPTRGHKKKARTRRRLIAAAVDVIGERGEAFSVSDVAAHAGVANGTFYNYFADRDALIEAILPEVITAFATNSAVTMSDADPVLRFATISAMGLTRAAVTPAEMRVLLRLDAAQQAILHGEPVRHLRDDIAAGHAAGRFAVGPSDAVLDVIVGSLLTAARRIVHDPGDRDYPCGVVEQLLRSLGITDPEASAIADQAITAARSQIWVS